MVTSETNEEPEKYKVTFEHIADAPVTYMARFHLLDGTGTVPSWEAGSDYVASCAVSVTGDVAWGRGLVSGHDRRLNRNALLALLGTCREHDITTFKLVHNTNGRFREIVFRV